MTYPEHMRQAIQDVDAIWALEGFERSPEVRRFDEALIAGEMTTRQVLEIFLAEAKKAQASKFNP